MHGRDRVVQRCLGLILDIRDGIVPNGILHHDHGMLSYHSIAETYEEGRIRTNGITRLLVNQLNPEMGRLVGGIIQEQERRPSGVIDEVTCDIFPLAIHRGNGLGDMTLLRITALEVKRSVGGRGLCLRPVVKVDTQILVSRDLGRIQHRHIPGVLTGRVHVSVLPVEEHRVGETVFQTSYLRGVDAELDGLIRLDTNVTRYGILRDELMEQAVHKLILEGRYIVFHTGFLQRFVHQFRERLGTLMGIYRTLTNRHLAIHIVLERSGSLDRSGTIQLIVQSAGVGVDIVILDIRQADEIPVFLVVARDLVIHVRYYHLRIFLVRIYRSRSIGSGELVREIDGVRRTNLDIEFQIT